MSKHQKRMSAPGNYPVKRKDGSYVVRSEGPYPETEGVPLVVVLRDILGYTDNMSEVKQVLSTGKVLVNGRKNSNPRSNVGFMDVISIPGMDEHYRVLVTSEGLRLTPIDEDEADRKLARIEDKTTLKGGVTQLNLHDGNNIETQDGMGTGGSVLVTLPNLEIEDEVGYEEGNLAYIIGGGHVGEVAEVKTVNVQPGSQKNTVTLEGDDGEFETVERNVYMIGETEPLLEVGADE